MRLSILYAIIVVKHIWKQWSQIRIALELKIPLHIGGDLFVYFQLLSLTGMDQNV
jgi:hypothetical protein